MAENDFQKDLKDLLNQYCVEDNCDVPDFILAEMITGFIMFIGPHVKATLDWHGCNSVCHPKKEENND